MDFFKIFAVVLFCVAETVVLVFALIGRKPIKILFLNAIIGVGTLVLLKAAESVSGVFIPINQYTVSLCGTMGLPAVVGILILRLVFI